MGKFLSTIAKLILLGSLLTIPVFGQQIFYSNQSFTAVGVGSGINTQNSGIAYFQIQWHVQGTISACNIQLDSSKDGITWNSGDIIASTSCIASGMSAITNFIPNFIRPETVTSFTGGGTLVVEIKGWSFNPAGSGGVTSNVNINQVGGAGITLGSKTSANSFPVVIASDQGSFAVTLGANQSVNEAQINGVTPLMGNGVTGTGSQRVTIASDNTAFGIVGTGTATVSQFVSVIAPPTANTTFASSNSSQTALTTAVAVKGSSGTFYGAYFINNAATVCYLEFMNVASAPTLGTGATFSLGIPVGGVLSIRPGDLPIQGFGTGISIGAATTYNGATACTTGLSGVLWFQ